MKKRRREEEKKRRREEEKKRRREEEKKAIVAESSRPDTSIAAVARQHDLNANQLQGWLHADGYAGFEDLYRRGPISDVGCLAHVQRKFFDIHLAQGSAIAKEALERIAELYQIEDAIRGKQPEERRRIRQDHAAPRLDSLEHWLRTQLTRISGKSTLADVIRYGLSRLQRLRPYLEDGRLAIDNNAAERGMRGIAVGRKN